MEVKFFKDQLFDLLNDSDSMGISDIETDDRNNIFTIKTIDGSMFEIECRQIKWKENKHMENVCLKKNKRKLWISRIALKKRVGDKLGIKDKIFKKKRNVCQKKFYELTYIIEDNQRKRLSELAERFRRINGWNEKEMLQFAVTATQQVDIDMKLQFLEGIIGDLESGERNIEWA